MSSDGSYFIDNSKFISLFKKWADKFYLFLESVPQVYRCSLTYKISIKLIVTPNVFFCNSTLAKMSNAESGYPGILYGSKAINLVGAVCKKTWDRLVFYFRNSRMRSYIMVTMHETQVTIIKALSLVIIAAIPVNIFLSMLLKREVSLFGWTVRLLFLAIGLCGSFSGSKWDDVKNTSYIFK